MRRCPGEEPVPGRLLRQSALLSQLVYAWDAMNTFWNDQVVAFGDRSNAGCCERFSFEDSRTGRISGWP